jgi:hypothetical protein
MPDPRVLDLMHLKIQVNDNPFTAIIVNRSQIHLVGNKDHREKLYTLSRNDHPRLVKHGDIGWDEIMVQHPQVIETMAIHLGNMNTGGGRFTRKLLRHIKQACYFCLQHRKPWSRGKNHAGQRGRAVAMLSRLNHFGELGYLLHFFALNPSLTYDVGGD